ncbi:MAG: hypothetical protein GTN80_09995 [Nitrososphaeria archaeon]|nr:hypothetical protein [Nitrososphaeria archaeon]NIQ33953.1 hypothetical protein [Nitrososphaeria archaeon]
MQKYKSWSKFIVLFLVANLILTMSPVPSVEAQPTVQIESRDERRAKFFVEVAQHAKERLEQFVARLEEAANIKFPDDFPDEIGSLFDEASSSLENAKDKVVEGDYVVAIELARDSMKGFREVFKELVRFKEAEQIELENGSRWVERALNAAIERAFERIDRIEETIDRLREKEIDISEVEDYLEEAKEHLENATDLLTEGNLRAAAQELGHGERLIFKALVAVKRVAWLLNNMRIRIYMRILNGLIKATRFSLNMADRHGLDVADLQERVDDLQVSLSEVPDLLEDGDIEAAINRLRSVRREISSIFQELVIRIRQRRGSGG